MRAALNQADLVTPDGMPVVWMLRFLGFPGQQRINGPDLMWKLCEQAAQSGQPIFLYGNRPATLMHLQVRLQGAFPRLCIAGAIAPPFRALSLVEEEAILARIKRSGARLVFVSLGCPKQELWMAAHRGRIEAVMLGVGAAFDYHAGTQARAPLWMQRAGLEWLARLCTEPRRLWRRYALCNSRFVLGAARQLLLRLIHRL